MPATHPPDKILVIEDDPAIRETLGEILEDEGYSVLGAANGQEALRQLQDGCRPCLILLDLMMPVMNGWEFRTRQQADPSLDTIPVVILSGGGNVQQSAADLNAAGYLSKPVKLETRLDVVEQFCQAS